MLKRKLCEATFQWELKCEGPLLIRDGRYTAKGQKAEGFPDCLFISHLGFTEFEKIAERCGNKPPDLPFYVPGTSIRGPFRALAERIIRSLAPEDAPLPFTACDPFEQNDVKSWGCSTRLEKAGEHKSKYALACPACKIFGCAGLASRTRFTDADIESYRSVYRDMIGIDRFTGGVYTGGAEGSGGANMRFHVLEDTTFTTTINITNFELWQLGLLAYVFRDFQIGMASIGYGKTKGFGQVKGKIKRITVAYPTATGHIEHMGSLMGSANERSYYGVAVCDAPEFAHFSSIKEPFLLYQMFEVNDTSAFFETVAPFFNRYIEDMKRQGKGWGV